MEVIPLMSDDEDPFKYWYEKKEQPPAADAIQDMTISSRMPPPGSDAGGNGPRREWPQPPPRSAGTPRGRGGNGQYGGNPAYGETVGYGANQGYGGNPGYGQPGYQGAPP